MQFEAVIGLEVHAQLRTKTKIFCACANRFGDEANRNVCPVCLGLPGALPVMNKEAVAMGVRAALALDCSIQSRSVFARKNYFYPDLPKGYQISQYDLPFAKDGRLRLRTDGPPKIVRIERIHLEEDAGKNIHGANGLSLVDLNRAGTPLIEIVTRPDLRSADDAVEYLKALRELLMAIGVNDGNLEEGSFRCDVNISVRRVGTDTLGTRVEIKNMSSFRFIHRAIEHEFVRQCKLVEKGELFRQHSRQWDEANGRTLFMREKEDSDDYRYFPDPDLSPLVIDETWIATQQMALPELPAARRDRLEQVFHLSRYDADVLTSHVRIGDYFLRVIEGESDLEWVKRAANFMMTEVLADTVLHGMDAAFPIDSEQLREIVALLGEGRISSKQAKELYGLVRGTAERPRLVAAQRGMEQLSDADALLRICERVVAANNKQRDAFRVGKTGVMGFFVGQVMKETGGAANPGLVTELLKRVLSTN